MSFGTSSAPYLATRCVQQIAFDTCETFKEASRYIHDSFYVDDLIASFETESKATKITSEINTLLSKYCLPMKKWTLNHPNVLSKLPKGDTRNQFNDFDVNRTLGLDWESIEDVFNFPTKFDCDSIPTATKRSIHSTISSIFDLLGLIRPVIVKSKIILQRLWQVELSWDESIPIQLETMWYSYYTDLSKIPNIKIPRQVLCNNKRNGL